MEKHVIQNSLLSSLLSSTVEPHIDMNHQSQITITGGLDIPMYKKKEVALDMERPICVSIGPYHRNDSKLARMENTKLRCFKYITTGDYLNLPVYLNANLSQELTFFRESYFCGRVEDFRKLYRQNYQIVKNTHGFLEMLILDACFIICFIISVLEMNDQRHKIVGIFKNSQTSTEVSIKIYII